MKKPADHRWTPSGRLFVILTILGLAAIGCFLWDCLALLWIGSLLTLTALLSWEWRWLRTCQLEMIEHRFNHQPTVQRAFCLTLALKAFVPGRVRFAVEAIESDLFRLERLQPEIAMADAELTATWELTAKERGNIEWPGAVIGYRTPLGLLAKWQTLPPVPVKVYPKLNHSLQTLLNPNMLLEQLGLKTSRFRRADQVFESLRPYQLGDNYRHIDWKASARSNSLITRVFQMEQHHNILVCLDSSRLMGTLTEGISKLDWAIEASLHLAYLADYLKDRIGLMVFSSGVDQWVKPHKQPVEAFLGSVYDVKSQIVEADLNVVCANILAQQRKRSLVIFLSDFMDASSLQPCLPAFAHLNRKHCSLFIGIEDPAYRRHLGESARMETAMDLTRRTVAQDSMNRREAVLQELRRMGLKAITTAPEDLVRRTVNAYLEIKATGVI
ncbi:MAG TPA: DUF58 domain-containing protein [Coleofasciculaceae cyanobacterium]|jgi:uncharacterized protein (DUF58 family)